MNRCCACRTELQLRLPVGRREVCPGCGADLHCCRNCTFFAPGTYNDCRETQAERVMEKERGNFCDFFRFREAGTPPGNQEAKPPAASRLDALFKK